MSKRSATSKRAVSSPSTPKNKKVKIEEGEIALNLWRVVLTGEFDVKPKLTLERILKENGVTITSSISGKTTHLLLGNKSGVNEYGKKTGIGSTKHKQALERGLTIINEGDVWSILTTGKTKPKLAAKKTSPLTDKVMFCIQESSGGGLLSLVKIKQELQDRFGIKFDHTRSKNALKSALSKLLEENQIEKDGASYKFQIQDIPDESISSTFLSAKPEVAASICEKDYCPEKGRWRGLKKLSSKKSKFGRARCKACGEIIAKGQTQLEVIDDSLLKMVAWGPEHDGVGEYPAYFECGFSYDTIAKRKFFVHGNCRELAEEKFREQFHAEWKKVRVYKMRALM